MPSKARSKLETKKERERARRTNQISNVNVQNVPMNEGR